MINVGHVRRKGTSKQARLNFEKKKKNNKILNLSVDQLEFHFRFRFEIPDGRSEKKTPIY